MATRGKEMITTSDADRIIQSQIREYGVEEVPYQTALGRVLAGQLFADRDMPPFNRSTVDGVAIDFGAYEAGQRIFEITATQAAGMSPIPIAGKGCCIEIMTGAALHHSADTVIRYEDIEINDKTVTLMDVVVKRGQNVHLRGKDRKEGEVIVDSNRVITPPVMGLAASIGKLELLVKRLPRVIIVTTGDEMVRAEAEPAPYQLRRSNGIVLKAGLVRYAIQADLVHLKDDYGVMKNDLERCLRDYDVLLMSGGVSKGKFDHVPAVLTELKAEQLFHKIRQRPGKPFWFGKHRDNTLIFAFPGNPVSTFMCFCRYFIPWLEASLGIARSPEYAVLQRDVYFDPPVQYFQQVELSCRENGQWQANPVEGNGSGDFSQLTSTDAFMEFPLERNEFKKGEAYRIWRYNSICSYI